MLASSTISARLVGHCAAETNQISCSIDDHTVWFRSPDLQLKATPEALYSAFVIPCMLQGVTLEGDRSVCSQWYANICSLTEILADAWGIPDKSPVLETSQYSDSRSHSEAQFFSGGVDSFYSLLTSRSTPRFLIFVHGFDIALSDSVRFEHANNSLTTVSKAIGSTPCVISTNLRKHPLIASVNWNDAHGGALAAVAHLLQPHVGTVTIPPSWHKSANIVYGSCWQIDHLWSSRRLEIKHGDASYTRIERLRVIAENPLAQQHLRVCWENKAPTGNCSRCEKCVRTMLELHIIGKLENFEVFDLGVPLSDLIDSLPALHNTYNYAEALQSGVDRKLESSLKRLIRRSSTSSAEAIRAQNQSLMIANKQLEQEVRQLQATIHGMSQTRLWKVATVLRRLRIKQHDHANPER